MVGIFTSLLLGCTPRKEKKHSADLTPRPLNEILNSENLKQADSQGRYQLEDSLCQQSETPVSFDRYESYTWDGDTTFKYVTKSEAFITNRGFESKSISKAMHGFKSYVECTLENNTSKCQEQTKSVISNLKELRICRENGRYKRDSVEGVSLTSTHHIDQTWEYYQSLTNYDQNMERSTLVVLPRYEERYTLESDGKQTKINHTMTDNLAFNFRYQDDPKHPVGPAFIVFPTSDSAFPSNNLTPHLWESPWAMSHEFGHHILFQHSGIGRMGANRSALHKLLSEHQHVLHTKPLEQRKESSQGLNLTNDREVGLTDHWGAINEAYADVYAFYSIGAPTKTTSKLGCLEFTRDIQKPTFANAAKTEKILNTKIWQVFLSSTHQPTDNCTNPMFQSIHTMGGVVAYGINQVFTADFDEQKLPLQYLGELAITWADEIGQLLQSPTENISQLTLEDFTLQAIRAIKSKESKLSETQCNKAKLHFPVFYQTWKSEGEINECSA